MEKVNEVNVLANEEVIYINNDDENIIIEKPIDQKKEKNKLYIFIKIDNKKILII